MLLFQLRNRQFDYVYLSISFALQNCNWREWNRASEPVEAKTANTLKSDLFVASLLKEEVVLVNQKMKSLVLAFVSFLAISTINCEVYHEETFPDGKFRFRCL